MKQITFFVVLLIFCNIASAQKTTLENIPDSLLSNRQFMEKLLPQVVPFACNKTQLHLVDISPDSVELMNRYPELYIGKFIDSVRTFAILYEELDSVLTFFRLQDNKWKKVSLNHSTNCLGNYFFEELNGTKNLEILVSSVRNMNGNSWIDLFTYSEEKDSVLFAGNFCCDYEVNLAKRTLQEEHQGSWYMDLYKTIYVWNKGMLVPQKHIRLTLLNPDMRRRSKYAITLWDNPELTYTSKFRLLLKDKYRERKHKKLWETFFEQN